MLKTEVTIHIHPYNWSVIERESLWKCFANGFVHSVMCVSCLYACTHCHAAG